MSDFDIRKHKWRDESITIDEDAFAEELTLDFAFSSNYTFITKEDSIALAKHFGHYKEPTDA